MIASGGIRIDAVANSYEGSFVIQAIETPRGPQAPWRKAQEIATIGLGTAEVLIVVSSRMNCVLWPCLCRIRFQNSRCRSKCSVSVSMIFSYAAHRAGTNIATTDPGRRPRMTSSALHIR